MLFLYVLIVYVLIKVVIMVTYDHIITVFLKEMGVKTYKYHYRCGILYRNFFNSILPHKWTINQMATEDQRKILRIYRSNRDQIKKKNHGKSWRDKLLDQIAEPRIQ